MKTYKIAVLPLDGVGKEVIPLAAQAMEKAQRVVGGFGLEMQTWEAGVEYAVRTGRMMPENLKAELDEADAILCGSGGHYDLEMQKTDYPGYQIGVHIAGFLRGGMGNTIGLRPLKLLNGLACPLKNVEEIDVFLVRQLTEGHYVNPGRIISDDAAYDTMVVTR
ncbi:MAG: isocitrate dehydrogenase, partial [Oscillospiraceae bacterium]|nr:isocitrate dehydrogenase [Oscillospiraceae bacterium]